MKCKHCGSEELRKKGIELQSGSIRKQRWQCKKCGGVTLGDAI